VCYGGKGRNGCHADGSLIEFIGLSLKFIERQNLYFWCSFVFSKNSLDIRGSIGKERKWIQY
jgi:hypothetical protein